MMMMGRKVMISKNKMAMATVVTVMVEKHKMEGRN